LLNVDIDRRRRRLGDRDVAAAFVTGVLVAAACGGRLFPGRPRARDLRLGRGDFDGRGGLDSRPASRVRKPLAHRFRQAGLDHAHVIGRNVAEPFLLQLVKDGLALDAKFLGQCVDPDAFFLSQTRLQSVRFWILD
jgi:hypothetical protein